MNKLVYVKPLLAAAALLGSGGAFAAKWTVVPETSTVSFIGAQQGTRFNGKFQTFSANINLDAADPTKGSIVGTVQTASVNTRDHDRDAALLEKDWFSVKEFPEARFESKTIEKAADGSYQANGQLTLKGTTKPAILKFTFSPAEVSGAKGAQFSGTMAINRFDFNVGEGWNDTSWVSQDVSVEIKLDLKQ
ncbi:MAG TPA: YceI family protein [Gammaproteobacteria bacterium]|nr:YceI family protein [Gammaproteobacteria bacterium]